MTASRSTRFKCSKCGKLTAGRMPVSFSNRREVGDGSFRFPRWHKSTLGDPCPGVYDAAEWVVSGKGTPCSSY